MRRRKTKRLHPTFEMIHTVLSDDFEDLRELYRHMGEPNRERSLVLDAHLVTEAMLTGMIQTSLKRPEKWLNDASYRSKLNLATAMGLIGDEEHAILCVLNSARNAVAHVLDPPFERWKHWKVELERLTAKTGKPAEARKDLAAILKDVVCLLTAPWLYAHYYHKRLELRLQHTDRWLEIMSRKLGRRPKLRKAALDLPDEAVRSVIEEVDVELAKQLRDSRR